MTKALPYACIATLILLVTFSSQAKVHGLTCDFDTVAINGEIKMESLALKFIIDTEAQKSYTMANQSSVEVEVIENDSGLTFLEVTGTGNVITTTISFKGKDKMKAVHSRNSLMAGNIIAQQFYGKCKAN